MAVAYFLLQSGAQVGIYHIKRGTLQLPVARQLCSNAGFELLPSHLQPYRSNDIYIKQFTHIQEALIDLSKRLVSLRCLSWGSIRSQRQRRRKQRAAVG